MIRCSCCDHAVADLASPCSACGWRAGDGEGYLDLLAAAGAGANGALDDAAFERLVSAEDRSFWFRARNQLLIWALDTYFPAAKSLLEVGCGNGYVLAGLAASHAGLRLAGSDLSGAGLRHARERMPAATLLRADARKLPFEEEFDVIGAFDIVEHVPEDRLVLSAMRRAVRAGGGVMITVPQHGWLWSEADRYSGHQRRYSRPELAAKLGDCGFRLRRLTSFVTLLLPLMAASRLHQAVLKRSFDPAGELAIAARGDRILERVMSAERRLIARNLDLPIGGSLLAIADRA